MSALADLDARTFAALADARDAKAARQVRSLDFRLKPGTLELSLLPSVKGVSVTTLRMPLPLAAFHVLSDRVLIDAYEAGQRSGDAVAAAYRAEGTPLSPEVDAAGLYDRLTNRGTPPAIPAGLLAAEAHHDYCGLEEEQEVQYREGFLRAILSAVL